MLKKIIYNYEDLTFNFEIIDENSKKYQLDNFIEILEKIKIIEQGD